MSPARTTLRRLAPWVLAPWWLAAAAPAGATVAVQHDGTHWVLQARRAEPAAVWQALAAASGSTLSAPATAGTRPLTLHWRGTRLHDAWQRVLGHGVNHALQCDRRRCRVWVLGPVAAAPAVGPKAADAAPGNAAQPVVDPGDLRHPDPPGLFPDDEP